MSHCYLKKTLPYSNEIQFVLFSSTNIELWTLSEDGEHLNYTTFEDWHPLIPSRWTIQIRTIPYKKKGISGNIYIQLFSFSVNEDPCSFAIPSPLFIGPLQAIGKCLRKKQAQKTLQEGFPWKSEESKIIIWSVLHLPSSFGMHKQNVGCSAIIVTQHHWFRI